MLNILELKRCLDKYTQAKQDYDEVQELIRLSKAKDGKWHGETPKINYQVAYQENIGSNNYHNSIALNNEIQALLKEDLWKYKNKAIENIAKRFREAEKDFSKYQEKSES